MNDIDILEINKTNIAEQQGKFMIKKDSNYVGFWKKANESKIKGSGVEIVISKAWKKHLDRVIKFSNYYIDILLIFKKIKIVVIIVYIPPSDKEEKKKIQQ